MTEAIFIKDRSGCYLDVNPACAKLFGTTPDAVVGSDDDVWFGAEGGERQREVDRWIVESGDAHTYEEEVQLAGRRLVLSITKSPYLDCGGRVLGVVGCARDASASHTLRLKLRALQERLDGIAASAQATLCSLRLSPDGTLSFPYLSAGISRICGQTGATSASDPNTIIELIRREDLERVRASFVRSADALAPCHCEFRVASPEAGELWLEARMRPQQESDGSICWHGILSDITERRARDAELRTSEATLRAVVQAVPDSLLLVGRDRRIRYINHLLPGWEREQVIGTDALELVSPSMRDLAATAVDHVLATGEVLTSEAPAVSPDGSERWFKSRVGPVAHDGEVVAVTLVATDVTEARLAEETLRASEERYRKLVELLPDAVFINTAGKISFCNAAFARLIGALRTEEVVGRDPLAFFAPEGHARIRARIARMVSRNEPAPPEEQTVVALDGRRRPVSAVATPILDGKDRAFLVVLHDLTPSQRTEHLLHSVLESVNDAIITADVGGNIVSCNPATARLFGYEHEQLIGRNVRTLVPEAHRRDHDRGIRQQAARGGTLAGGTRELSALRADGSTFPIDLTITGFRLDGTQHYTGVIRDITERKKLEDEFRQAHKMEAFGQLAGGVAHDFNNLLTVILSETDFVLSELPEDHPAFASLSDVHEAGQRAAGLTRQLLAFSRKTVLEPRVIDINGVVRDTEKILRRLIGEDILLSTKLAPTLKQVNVDPGQLAQVLMNLAVNSRDAMPRGGKLEIETSNVDVDEARPFENLSPGPYVRLWFRDSGMGMPAAVRERVFQPFFTTKGVGHGTGLGLAVVHGIVTQSGGAIRLESEEGAGTSFEILLPVATPAPPKARRQRVDTDRPASQTVLLVEDDEAVRRLAVRVLAAKGYRVLLARDGEQAMHALAQDGAKIDLLVTDVVMPNMDGRELGEALRERFPDVKVLYVSGYTDDMLMRRGLMSAEVDFLAKPYTSSLLQQAVRDALAKP